MIIKNIDYKDSMFNFFKKKNPQLVIPTLGKFEILYNKDLTIIEGKYDSRTFGKIKLSFQSNINNVNEHQICTLKLIENNWKDFESKIDKDFRVDSIKIPTYKCSYFDVDAEIVFMNKNKNIISAIFKDGKISEIIKIQ